MVGVFVVLVGNLIDVLPEGLRCICRVCEDLSQ